MTDDQLQKWVEDISLRYFNRPFRHRATFNPRLRTTGGRYFTKSHHIEISRAQYEVNGKEEVEKIIKHELCHYHLHLQNKGYRHRDKDFKELLERVGGNRYCRTIGQRKKPETYKYKLICLECGMSYMRKRKMNVNRYVCGKCRGRLQLVVLDFNGQS